MSGATCGEPRTFTVGHYEGRALEGLKLWRGSSALAEMHNAKAREFLATLLNHRDGTLRILVKRILEERPDTSGHAFKS